MGVPGSGIKGYWQVGLESTWATAVAATRRIPFTNMKPEPEAGVVRSQAIDGKFTRSAMDPGGRRGKATIEFELTYENLGLILDCIMGTNLYGTIGANVTGAGPYTTTYKQREFFSSLTHELVMGNIPTNKCERIPGGKITEAEFWGSSGLNPDTAICHGKVVIVGQDYQTNQNPTGGLTAGTRYAALFHEMTTDADGTADATALVVIKDWRLSIKNNLAETRWGAGAATILEPVMKSFREVKMSLTTEFQSRTALDAYMAGTQGNPNLIFTKGAKTIQFSMPKAYQVSPHARDQKDDLIDQKFEWEAISDGGSPESGLTIVTVNTESGVS